MTCKLISPHFSDFFHSYLVCILSKHESNKKNNYQILFLHVNFKDWNFPKFCYICALNHLLYLSKIFQIVRKPILSFFGGIRTSMKLKGSYEALKSYKSLSNFHFTDQNLYRPELQKILPSITFQLISLHLLFTFP